MKLRLILLFSLIITIFSSCNINKVHPVPNVPFDIIINLNLPTYNSLLGVGGYAIVESIGYKGVIIYRRSLNEFVAFDLQSPAEEAGCETPLQVNADNFLQLDDVCYNAKFSLFDGSPMEGSKFGLRMYIAQFDGLNNLRIMN